MMHNKKADTTIALISNGLPLRERVESGKHTVFLPYHSGYQILIKNQNDVDVAAEIIVDGTNAMGSHKLVIPAKNERTLKGFNIDGSDSVVREFTFVPLSDSRVQDPSSGENGIVRVRIYKKKRSFYEIFNEQIEKSRKQHPWNEPYPPYPWTPTSPWNPTPVKPIKFYSPYHSPERWKINKLGGHSVSTGSAPDPAARGITSSSAGDSYGASFSLSDSGSADQSFSLNCLRKCESNSGATVEGKAIRQRFQMINMDIEDTYEELVIHLAAATEMVTAKDTKKVYCQSCGKKNKFSSKFCTNCGVLLDKFANFS